ncbi:MAG: hypothetical protein EXR75_02480 [Myxococcales bacterium]|nr:hypothetical protein [Myxococcales bacterium]
MQDKATPISAPAETRTPPRKDQQASVEVRPPEGLARGRYAVAAWVVALIAGALVLGVVVFVLAKGRRARRSASRHSVAPPSSRK